MSRAPELKSLFAECNGLIVCGRFAQAREALSKVNAKKVPLALLPELCNLYRRAQLWEESLKLLHPRIRPAVSSAEPSATVTEKIEYAFALQRDGGYRESWALFHEPDVAGHPQALLGRAHHEIFHWNYAAAASYLEQFLRMPGLQPYEVLNARVNLLAAQSFVQDPAFELEFEKLKAELTVSGHQLLLGFVMEIGAQYLVRNRAWIGADLMLKEAEVLLAKGDNMYAIFVDKWRNIARAMKTDSTEPLDLVRARALKAKHWETVRDVDFIRASLRPESHWVNWVYFGTPFLAFRQRLEGSRPFPDQTIVSRHPSPEMIIDPWHTGDNQGELPQLFMDLLLRDFYRPFKAGHIFSELYWDEFWDVSSSHNRVHQLAHRLRGFIEKNHLPLKLLRIDGAYALRMKEKAGIIGRKKALPLKKLPYIFGRYESATPQLMNAKEWSQRLNMTTVKARNLLSEANQNGVVVKVGGGPATMYRVT